MLRTIRERDAIVRDLVRFRGQPQLTELSKGWLQADCERFAITPVSFRGRCGFVVF